MKNLVIVESPAKAKTIERILGKDFKVQASFGHVRDLPKGEFGIDPEKNFEPKYVIPKKVQKNVTALKKEMENADEIYLATDPDREGEAIAWHIATLAPDKKDKLKRIAFYEITENAIKNAVKNPTGIKINLVNAQQTRRILDRIVGYKLSPLLWKKIKQGLSAGRVQSVALKIIVEREKEIENFKPQEYWQIRALFEKESQEFEAELSKVDDKKIDKLFIKNKEQADGVLNDLKNAEYKVLSLTKKETKRQAKPPFITSTLQQDASSKHGFSTKKTMVVAQQLYEGVELGEKGRIGLITYMRTDSFNLASEAIDQIRNKISEKFGQDYVPSSPKYYKNRSKTAQEAHEAIRPTYIDQEPDKIKQYLASEQFKLYSLIWKRALACQMADAIFDYLVCDIAAKNYIFRTSGMKVKFDGYLKAYSRLLEERILPNLSEGEILDLKDLLTDQKFTEPPKRYTEATLVKALEENGVGRPSTYSPTISTIQTRGYVIKEEKKLKPQKIGIIVNDLLTKNFPEIIDVEFTAHLEEKLDEIASGKTEWEPIIKDFYWPFVEKVEKKYEEIEKIKFPEQKTDEKCEKCGKPMIIKEGRYGEFMACSGFPECKNTKPIDKKLAINCPECGSGLVLRKTRKGRIFYGCSSYPSCKFATWGEPQKEPCPKCEYLMVKQGKKIKCMKCDYEQ